jgi:hypothetical protein
MVIVFFNRCSYGNNAVMNFSGYILLFFLAIKSIFMPIRLRQQLVLSDWPGFL